MLFASDLYEHFVQKVSVAEARVSAGKTFGKLTAQLLDLESNGVLNDRRWQSMVLIDVFHPDMLPEERLTWQYLTSCSFFMFICYRD